MASGAIPQIWAATSQAGNLEDRVRRGSARAYRNYPPDEMKAIRRGQYQVPDQAHSYQRGCAPAQQVGKSALKTAVRRVRSAADAGDKAAAQVELAAASRSLDKAASKGVIHPNQAANRKSALASLVNSL